MKQSPSLKRSIFVCSLIVWTLVHILSCDHNRLAFRGFVDEPQDSILFDLKDYVLPASKVDLWNVVKCDAETMTRRLKAIGIAKYANGFKVTIHEESLSEPLKWRKPRNIFVCSMSDLFHKDVPFEFVDKVMSIIAQTPQHRYQILTKRAERMAEYFRTHLLPANVWL